MPELPEVETARRGIEPYLLGHRVESVAVRQRRLRWPVPPALLRELPGQRIEAVARRGKYLLLKSKAGTVILHLGMSGSLRVLPMDTPPQKHDHVDLVMDSGKLLRLRDPRRFGALLWSRDPLKHPLLRSLGPEPLDADFDGDHLFERSRGRRLAVKLFIMNSRIVVGVGNIYASEALFRAKVRPRRQARSLSRAEVARLTRAVRTVLALAIKVGGTTLRDYVGADGLPGYFRQKLYVYERASQPCRKCGTPVRQFTQGQRSTYYCPTCQK
jgi:formamidopyrimidine-DNA glycosylase